MISPRTALFLTALVLAFAAGSWFRGFLDIDRCLDWGGMWDGEQRLCIMEAADER